MSIAKILKMIKVNGKMHTKDIAMELGYSEATIAQWLCKRREPTFRAAQDIIKLAIRNNVQFSISDLLDNDD
jgi:transcriptional regulator with XRE-family HTH domain